MGVDNPQNSLELGSYLFKEYGPDGLKGPLFSEEFLAGMKSDMIARSRSAELRMLRQVDQRFIKEINEAIEDPEIEVILVVGFNQGHNEIVRRHLTDRGQLKSTKSGVIFYGDGTKVILLTEHNVVRGSRGIRADKIIVHEAIGWKEYTERIWPALAPCLIH